MLVKNGASGVKINDLYRPRGQRPDVSMIQFRKIKNQGTLDENLNSKLHA